MTDYFCVFAQNPRSQYPEPPCTSDGGADRQGHRCEDWFHMLPYLSSHLLCNARNYMTSFCLAFPGISGYKIWFNVSFFSGLPRSWWSQVSECPPSPGVFICLLWSFLFMVFMLIISSRCDSFMEGGGFVAAMLTFSCFPCRFSFTARATSTLRWAFILDL